MMYVRALAEKKQGYLRRAMNEENRRALQTELDALKELL